MKLHIWSAAALVLLSFSCTQGTEGIFASIEREQKIKAAGGLNANATVTHMTEYGGRYYIAGGGALFTRTLGAVKWHSRAIDASEQYRHVIAVGRTGDSTTGTLFVVANLDATDTNQLFSSTNGGTSWNLETMPAGKRAATLVPVISSTDGASSDRLLVVTTNTNGAYETVYLVTGAWPGAGAPGIDLDVTGNGGYSFPVTGAAVDGTDYYLVNNEAVMHNNGGAGTVTRVTGADLSGNGYYGIVILPASAPGFLSSLAVVTNTDRVLYWGTLAGNAWTSIAKKPGAQDKAGDDVRFGQPIYQNQTATTYVWVATLNGQTYPGAGFASLEDVGAGLSYELQPPSGTDKDNYRSSDLEISQIWCLYAAENGHYFAGTGSRGLWQWSPTTRKWSQE